MLNMMLLNPSQNTTSSAQGAPIPELGGKSVPNDFAARLQNLVDAQVKNSPTSVGEKHTPQEVLLPGVASSELKPGVELAPSDQVQPLPIEVPIENPGVVAQAIVTNPETQQPLLAQQNSMSADMLSRIEQAQALAQQLTQNGKASNIQSAENLEALSARADNAKLTSASSAVAQQLQQLSSGQTNAGIQLSAMEQTLKSSNNQLASVNSQTLTASQTAALQMAMQLSGQERASIPAGALPEGNPFLTDSKLPQTPQQPMPTWQPLDTPLPIKQAMPVAESALQGMNSLINNGAASIAANAATNGEQANMIALQTANASVASSSASPTGTLTAPLASNAWQQQLSQQVVNMNFRQDNQVALRLHPAELGPLMINLRMDDQAASLQFSAANANVRAAVETAIPQLREILAEQGIELAESSVNDGQAQQQNREQSSGSARMADNQLDTHSLTSEDNPERELDIQVGNGQIDLYA